MKQEISTMGLSQHFQNKRNAIEKQKEKLKNPYKLKQILFILILGLLITSMFSSCLTNEDKSREVLENAGYKDITLTGYSFFGCGSDDTYSTGFEATSVSGKHIKGVVCGGFMKGYTIREL